VAIVCLYTQSLKVVGEHMQNTHEALNMEIYNNGVITHDSYIPQMEQHEPKGQMLFCLRM